MYCTQMDGTGIGSATGSLSARESACLNKRPDDYCEFRGNKGEILHGTCKTNNNFLTKQPLFCSQSIGTGKSDEKDTDVKQ